MIFSTERLEIRPINLEDTAFYLTLLNTPNWIKFIGDRKVYTLDDAKAYIQNRVINSYDTYGFGFYKMVLKSTQDTIGVCGFAKREYLPHPDIGYAILPTYEGKGYTSEACDSMMQFGRNQLGLNTILGITAEINVASQHILSKIGLKQEGKIKDPATGEEILLYTN